MSRTSDVVASYAVLRREALGRSDETALLVAYDEREARELRAARSAPLELLRSLADHWVTFTVAGATGLGISHLLG